MPKSRGRKPKQTDKTPPQAAKPKGLLAKGWGVFVSLLGLAATAVGLVVLWPQPTIEPTNAPEPSNPFSEIFKIANTQFYPLEDVRIEAFPWCAKLGRGSDTTPPTMCERGMSSSKREWNKRILAGGESYEIDVGNVLFATPPFLLYADISMKITYKPWIIPCQISKEYRFYTRRKDDGGIEWLHKPLND
jgi:hypothetical protein